MKSNFGHEDAGLATPESLDTIVENFAIRGFLRTNDKRYIVGPKGSGKTLLLLRKAIDQRARADTVCIPSDPSNPVDRLTAAQHVGRQFNYSVSDTRDTNLAWASVWKNSIYRSVLHHLRDKILEDLHHGASATGSGDWSRDLEQFRFKAANKIIESYLPEFTFTPRGPYYYYTELGARLDSAKKNGLPILREQNLHLDSLVQLTQRPIYIFLDNLDDYYEREPELWYNSMYGQFRAVREISLTHRHIHIFTSIRRDVYSQFSDEMRLQYYDYIAQLTYSKEELLQIFASRICDLDDNLLAHPMLRKTDPWKAFFGETSTIVNDFVGVAEDIRDYIHRHTLGRPRDLIHMGTVLLERRALGGFSPDAIRDAVAAAEEDIAEQYLAEIAPMLDPRFDIRTFVQSFVTSNALTRSAVENIRDDFMIGHIDQGIDFDTPSDMTRPFETLYDLGLLGVVRPKPDSNEYVQAFQSPGRGLDNPENRDLPESAVYLLHPVLTKWLLHGHRNKHFVVGDKLPYHHPPLNEGTGQ